MTRVYFEECDCDCHNEKNGVPAKVHIVACCWTCHFCGKRIKNHFSEEDHWKHCSARQRALGRGRDEAGFFIERPLKIGEEKDGL